MNIETVDQTLVDARCERVERLTRRIHNFKQEMATFRRESDEVAHTAPIQHAPEVEEVEFNYTTTTQDAMDEVALDTFDSPDVGVDDIDLDAMIASMDLDLPNLEL